MDIDRLIPQRPPFVMVDRVTDITDDGGSAQLAITDSNYFLQADGTFPLFGLIEHVAQVACAVEGYRIIRDGGKVPSMSMLAEVRRFAPERLPHAGETLDTEITKGVNVNGVMIIFGKVNVGNECIANMQIKIFIPQN